MILPLICMLDRQRLPYVKGGNVTRIGTSECKYTMVHKDLDTNCVFYIKSLTHTAEALKGRAL